MIRPFDVKPIRGPWHIGSNVYTTRYVPGTNRLYERARLGCLPGGAGHGGRDIHNDTDDKILRAVWGGTIHRYGWDDYGNHIGLINSDGHEAFYAHLDAVHVSDGQVVKADTDLGILGATGNTSGPHLHFEVRTAATQWCTAIDPTSLLLAESPEEDEMFIFKKASVSSLWSFVSAGVRGEVTDYQWKQLGSPKPHVLPDDHPFFLFKVIDPNKVGK